jgi:hypothetical protein
MPTADSADSGQAIASEPRSERLAEREAVAFLNDTIVPSLRRAGKSPLFRAVRDVTESGEVGELARLTERQRRDLLEIIESGVARARRRASPRALVYLTSMISATPVPEAGLRRRFNSPAR